LGRRAPYGRHVGGFPGASKCDSHRENAQHATISPCFITANNHIAAGMAVAVVLVVVVRFMA
jgi:hypothetical protein